MIQFLSRHGMINPLIKTIMYVALCLFSTHLFAYSPYTTRELEELEQEFKQQINQSSSVLRTPLAIQYINQLAKSLAHYAHQKTPYFFIVKSNEINAFAGPGGYIGVNSQLILSTDNESELAAVMAHEMAHVRLHHLYRMIQHQKQMRIPMLASMLASIALGIVNPALGNGALMASMSGLAQDNINFTRSNEKEADRIGIDMLKQAGFNPEGMAGFFKKMQLNARYYYTAHIPAILRTHPLDEDRIAEAENRSLDLPDKTYIDSTEYPLFKELVRVHVAKDTKQLLDYYQKQCYKKSTFFTCQYGHALSLLQINDYKHARTILDTLLHETPDNLYFETAMAQAEIGLHQYASALHRLRVLKSNYPDNYAAAITYAEGLIQAGKAKEAVSVLLKSNRQFKQDLRLCQLLAQAHAQANRKDYAYFTLAECELIQGHGTLALRQLKQAERLAKKDHLLQARIQAKIEDIQFFRD